MNIDQRTYRRFYLLATWAFALAVVALWFPFPWHTVPSPQGTQIHMDLGVLKPLRATWQSSANGFWLAFSDVRIVALLLSAVLTAAAVIAARDTYRRSRTIASTLGRP